MAATYSIGSLAFNAANALAAKVVELPDTACVTGGQANAMQNGTQVLCKMPDGSQKWFTIDASRSIPGGVQTLVAV